MTVVSPKPTTRSRTRMTGSLLAMSHSNGGEEDCEKAVKNDHEKDRLHHRRGGLQPERLRAAFDLQPLGAGHDADDKRHEGRFDDANLEMGHGDGLVQPEL